MTAEIQTLADYLRSPDPANHILAATIASDEDFVAAVELLYEQAKYKFEAGGLPYHFLVFVPPRSYTPTFHVSFVSTTFENTSTSFRVGSWAHNEQCFTPHLKDAALHLKKLLLCENETS